MMHLLVLLHRYLGIAVGALMALWCASGVVMMYVSYPSLQDAARLKHLEPIEWSDCCKMAALPLSEAASSRWQIEMLAGRPVLTLAVGSKFRLLDLISGAAIERVSLNQASAVAKAFSPGSAAPALLGLVDHDQWTVAGDYDADRPLYRFALGDTAHTEIYVSSSSGRAVQMTNGRERFWNWLGAIPHWLYFTELRRRAALWNQIVIYTSLAGCVLTSLGIYLGLYHWLGRPDGRFSPFVGMKLWHHLAGLVFGIFTFSWVLSGLLSMNPWGWLEGAGAQAELAALHGPPLTGRLEDALSLLLRSPPTAAVSIESAPLNGQDYLIATAKDGERRRLDAGGAPAPLVSEDLIFIANALSGPGATAVPQLLQRADAFYFSHHRERVLPVYRLLPRDGSSGRYYIDTVSGMLVAKIDRNSQAYRWLHQGLHRMDFTAFIRRRPQWDALMLILMAGVTLLCATGTYLGVRRLFRL